MAPDELLAKITENKKVVAEADLVALQKALAKVITERTGDPKYEQVIAAAMVKLEAVKKQLLQTRSSPPSVESDEATLKPSLEN